MNVPSSFASTAQTKTVASSSVKKVAAKNAKRSNTSTVVNTLLNGIGAPRASLGVNGDFYIDTVTLNIYGPKTKNAWPIPKSLIGPQGVAGAAGKQGINGKDGRDGVNGKDGRDGVNGKDGERGASGASGSGSGSAGPAGPAGPTGPAGPAGPAGASGAQGAPGVAGAAGAQGIQGEVGPRGLQGIQGETGAAGAAGAAGAQGIQGEVGPRGLQGIQGETGAAGAAGAAGAQGIQGIPGAAGAAGAQGIQGIPGAAGAAGAQGIPGPVQIYFSDLNFTSSLSGTTGATKDSSDFGVLIPGKKYLLTAYVYATSQFTEWPPLRAAVSAVGADVTPVTKFSTTTGFTYRSTTAKQEWGLSIHSTIDGGALAGSNYQLRLAITCGLDTSGAQFELLLRGYYVIQEVSSIN